MNAAAPVHGMLRKLYLGEMARVVDTVSEKAGREGWGHEAYLRTLCERELSERSRRKTARLLKESGLPSTKTLASLDMNRFPQRVRMQVPSLLEGAFVERAENVLAFGLPGRGKTHLLCAIAYELIMAKGIRVLFSPAMRLVQKLLAAKRDLRLDALLKRLDLYDVILLDDIGYIQQSRHEMEALFALLAERYERKSIMITSNLVFSEWDTIFKDPMTTAAAIDRLVHHSIILELEGESFRMSHALSQHKKGGS